MYLLSHVIKVTTVWLCIDTNNPIEYSKNQKFKQMILNRLFSFLSIIFVLIIKLNYLIPQYNPVCHTRFITVNILGKI